MKILGFSSQTPVKRAFHFQDIRQKAHTSDRRSLADKTPIASRISFASWEESERLAGDLITQLSETYKLDPRGFELYPHSDSFSVYYHRGARSQFSARNVTSSQIGETVSAFDTWISEGKHLGESLSPIDTPYVSLEGLILDKNILVNQFIQRVSVKLGLDPNDFSASRSGDGKVQVLYRGDLIGWFDHGAKFNAIHSPVDAFQISLRNPEGTKLFELDPNKLMVIDDVYPDIIRGYIAGYELSRLLPESKTALENTAPQSRRFFQIVLQKMAEHFGNEIDITKFRLDLRDDDHIWLSYDEKDLNLHKGRYQALHALEKGSDSRSYPVYLADLSQPDGIKPDWNYLREKLGLEN